MYLRAVQCMLTKKVSFFFTNKQQQKNNFYSSGNTNQTQMQSHLRLLTDLAIMSSERLHIYCVTVFKSPEFDAKISQM